MERIRGGVVRERHRRNPRLGADGRLLTNRVSTPSRLLMDPPPTQDSSQPQPKRRRRAQDSQDDAPTTSPGTRRLRRSHEACARCRSKKIKASSVGLARRQFPLTASSAIPSTPAVQLVRQLALFATRRTDTGRPSPHAATQSVSSISSPSARLFSSTMFPGFLLTPSMTICLERALIPPRSPRPSLPPPSRQSRQRLPSSTPNLIPSIPLRISFMLHIRPD